MSVTVYLLWLETQNFIWKLITWIECIKVIYAQAFSDR